MKVIAITGKAGSGKDYLATHLKEILETRYEQTGFIFHFADNVKLFCKQVYGWDGKKDGSGRTLLQQVGTEIAQKNYQTIWVDIVLNLIAGFYTEFDFCIIADMRFPHEIERLNQVLPIAPYIIKILGSPNCELLSKEQTAHASETSLDNYEYKYDYIFNNTTYDKGLFLHQLENVAEKIFTGDNL